MTLETEVRGSTKQGMPSANRNWKMQGADSPQEPLQRVWPCRDLNFRLLASRTMKSYISVVLSQGCGNLLWQLQETNADNPFDFKLCKIYKILSILDARL